MDKNLLPNDPSTGSLVSIIFIGISSKSFPWPVHSVQEISPNFLRRWMPVDGTSDCLNGRGLRPDDVIRPH